MWWLWTRALVYMCAAGGGWLVLLPACLSSWERPGAWPALRPWPWLVTGVCLFALGVGLALWAGYYLIR